MSVVGPRPEVEQYVRMYTPDEMPILRLRPGITDWASIWNADEGAALAEYADPDKAYETLIRPTKLRLQLKYAYECSLRVDLKVLCATVMRLLHGATWYPQELAAYDRLLNGKTQSDIGARTTAG